MFKGLSTRRDASRNGDYSAPASSLRQVISFDFLGILLHDPIANQLRFHAVSTEAPYLEQALVIPVRRDHGIARVWFEQKPLVLSRLEDVFREQDALRLALERGIRALMLVPLSNGSHRLGILAFGLAKPFQPDESVLKLVERVASEFAVAMDVSLTRYAFQRERDRMQVLFEVTNALVSKLSTEDLFSTICEQLSRVVRYDLAAVGLLDNATGELHLSAFHSPTPIDFEIEPSLRPEGLPLGEALATGSR